jgi:hypothetical protein
MAGDWTKPMFALHDTGNYCCAAIFPCIVINDIGRSLLKVEGHNDVHSCAACFLSGFFDIPCMFGAVNAQRWIKINYFDNPENNTNEEEIGDEWNPEDSYCGPDWWPLDWCRFYTLGACETCCGAICIGPNVHCGRFPLLFSCMLGCIYPICICPMACAVRLLAVERLNIKSESEVSSCVKTVLCAPCSLTQIQEELKVYKSTTTSMTPILKNSMGGHK